MINLSSRILATLLSLIAMPLVAQYTDAGGAPAPAKHQFCDPVPPAAPVTAVPRNTPVCSYTALNPTCYITMDRLNPLAPPTIYMSRGQKIYLVVYDPSPFEELTLDLKSATAQVPPDQFYNGFTALTGALSGFQVTQIEAAPVPAPPPPVPPAAEAQQHFSAPEIAREQKDILDEMQQDFLAPARDALEEIRRVLKGVPTNLCSQPPEVQRPWKETDVWVTSVSKGLQAALNGLGTDQFETEIAALDPEIDALASDGTTPMAAIFKLRNNQKTLRDGLKVLGDAQAKLEPKLQALIDEVKKIQPADPNIPTIVSIDDLHRADRNYQVELWNLNYTNRLASVAKRVAGDTYVKPNAALLAGLADAPSKQPVVALTAQFQSSNRLEISGGFMVPVTAYHSYTAAQSYSASAPVVQKNKIYTVVPDASFHVLLHELVADRQRVAFFLTGAVGYTPATSSVAFGIGPSISWRSIVVSFLADVGRDSQLAGGYTVGGSLGTGTSPASAPQTKNVWDVKFAPGLSVRIPLGGASQ